MNYLIKNFEIPVWLKYWLYNKSKKLPSEYQRIQYLETDGTQYVDTGYIANQDTRFVMKINYISGNFIFGADDIIYGNVNAVGLNSSNNKFRWHYDNQNYKDNYTFSYGNLYCIDINKNKMYINNTLAVTFDYETFETSNSVIISGIKRAGSINMIRYGSSLHIYSFKIYDDETLALDLIPCYRKADSVQGLYDIVNEEFHEIQTVS